MRRSALAAGVRASGWTDLVDLKARCEALSAFAEDPRFQSLAQSAKRIGNILKEGLFWKFLNFLLTMPSGILV